MTDVTIEALSLAEEVVLLALDDKSGDFINMYASSFEVAVIGALLSDLAQANRIDTDLKTLILVDPGLTGDLLYDPLIESLQRASDASGTSKNVRDWILEFSSDAESMIAIILQRLCDRGILKSVDRKFLWVSVGRRYPKIDKLPDREVRTRIRSVLLEQEMPDSRDAIIICLANASGILNEILTEEELAACEERLELVCKLDLIGQAVSKTVALILLEIHVAAFTVLPV